jgi:hypothetical protein
MEHQDRGTGPGATEGDAQLADLDLFHAVSLPVPPSSRGGAAVRNG